MDRRRGAQPGNKNSAKGKEWTAALKHALKRYENNSIKRNGALRALAWKVVEDALEGKEYAVREITERLDGKVSTGDGDRTVRVLVVRSFPETTETPFLPAEVVRDLPSPEGE